MRLASLLGPNLDENLLASPAELAELLEEVHAADLSELIAELEDPPAVKLLTNLPREAVAEALDFMEHGRRAELVEQIERSVAAELTDLMSADERVDLLQELEPDVRADILSRMDKEERQDVRDLINYSESSAGGLMTTEYVALSPELTVERAIEQVRRTAEEKETIYEAYAVDPNGTLVGVISLRQLLLAPASRKLSDLMEPDVVSVPVEMDQEEVAHVFQRYDLLALPVVDSTHKLLGIVTVDDVVHVLKEEQAEDIQKLGAVAAPAGSYFDTSFWTYLRSRAVWLVVLFIGQSFTVSVLKHYGTVTATVVALTFFIPLIISSGGNTGNQAAALVIRGMALGEFEFGDAAKILWRECRMGLALGGILGCLGMVMAAFIGNHEGVRFALAVGTALVACVTLGSVVGAGMPLLIRRLGLDPAVASGPFIASLLDVMGIFIYVETAVLMLGLARH
ncbi:MAG: magnesium transporter [Deltaproteobacteria bacterium]|nr:magnesium transporter [Deltaproteobacteria bacterium]